MTEFKVVIFGDDAEELLRAAIGFVEPGQVASVGNRFMVELPIEVPDNLLTRAMDEGEKMWFQPDGDKCPKCDRPF
jgi:hypothetical protein